MATDNRFIKINGAFERTSDRPYGSPATGYYPTYDEAEAAANSALGGRTLDIGGGTSQTPGSPLPQEKKTGPAPSPYQSGDPMDNVNVFLQGMLKSAQGLTSADILKKKRLIERTVLDKTSDMTPEELRTLSPGQQDSIRSGNVKALQPEIDDNAYQLEKAQQSIDNFFKVYDKVYGMSQDYAEKMAAPDSVITNAVKVIEADPDKMATVLAGFNDKSKQKILEKIDYNKISSGGGGKVVDINGTDYIQNPDGTFSTPDVPGGGKKSATSTSVISVVDELLNDPGLNGITGVGQNPLNIFGITNAKTLNKYNQLKGMLALENRQQLKGSGAISDFEFRVLGQASSALGRNLSNADFRAELENLKKNLTNGESGGEAETKTVDGIQYKKVEGGWQKVSFNGAGGGNRPQKNNNPLNIKASTTTSAYPGVVGTDPSPASDGGKFLVFNSPEAGISAGARLLKSGVYSGLSVDQAMRKWSNNGYGGEIAPSLKNRTVASLSSSEVTALINSMAKREGYYA